MVVLSNGLSNEEKNKILLELSRVSCPVIDPFRSTSHAVGFALAIWRYAWAGVPHPPIDKKPATNKTN